MNSVRSRSRGSRGAQLTTFRAHLQKEIQMQEIPASRSDFTLAIDLIFLTIKKRKNGGRWIEPRQQPNNFYQNNYPTQFSPYVFLRSSAAAVLRSPHVLRFKLTGLCWQSATHAHSVLSFVCISMMFFASRGHHSAPTPFLLRAARRYGTNKRNFNCT